jgi:hypothetical protein
VTFASEELRRAQPCPFCRCAQLWMWDKGVPGKFAVACSNPDCAATGPVAETERDAVARWNTPTPRRVERGSNAALERVLDESTAAPHSSGR